VTQHEHHEKLLPRPLPAEETLLSEKHRDGLWHCAYPTATMTLCSRWREERRGGRPGRPTCLICRHTARAIFRIDRSAPAWWFTTSGGAASTIPSPVAPPEDCEKDAA
jgi:hypothetical protein